LKTERFTAILTLLVPSVVQAVAEQLALSESEAIDKFYESHVYALLEDEQTGVWHYSPQLLSSLLVQELRTGTFTLPEEAA